MYNLLKVKSISELEKMVQDFYQLTFEKRHKMKKTILFQVYNYSLQSNNEEELRFCYNTIATLDPSHVGVIYLWKKLLSNNTSSQVLWESPYPGPECDLAVGAIYDESMENQVRADYFDMKKRTKDFMSYSQDDGGRIVVRILQDDMPPILDENEMTSAKLCSGLNWIDLPTGNLIFSDFDPDSSILIKHTVSPGKYYIAGYTLDPLGDLDLDDESDIDEDHPGLILYIVLSKMTSKDDRIKLPSHLYE